MSAGSSSTSTPTATSYRTASTRTSAARSPPPTRRWTTSTPRAASTSTRRRYRCGDADPFASGSRGDLVNDIAQGIGAVIELQDGNVFGRTDVYLEGRRHEVRTEETNFGDLSSDANLWYAQQIDPTVMVAIRNGGGIRDSIGRVEAVGGVAQELPPGRTRRSASRRATSRSSISPTRSASTTRSPWSR